MSFISLRENLANKCLMIKNKFKKMNAVEPPLRANSPQRPFFREGGGGAVHALRFNCKIKKE